MAVDERGRDGGGARPENAGIAIEAGTPAAPSAPASGQDAAAQPGRRRPGRFGRALAGSPVARHLLLLACYLAAGVAVTWPRATWLADGRLPATRDGGAYVWGFWWVAHAIEHLSNPWFTHAITAPVGVQLGYHALMPLEGAVMMPVTVLFGPAVSYNLLSIVMPGLSCYAMYRAAKLWLPSQTGAIAAGAFFGLSSIVTWHAWYQLNLATGMLFLPLALEAAVRLSRDPSRKRAVILGVVLGASLLTDQESAIMVLIVAAGALLPWLIRRPRAAAPGGRAAPGTPGAPDWRTRLGFAIMAGVVTLVVASPQLGAMAAQSQSGGASFPAGPVAVDYALSGANFPGMFAVSPRAVRLGLTALKPISYHGPVRDGVLTFGLVLTVLAAFGLIVSWRRRSAWLLAALWLGSAALALGSVLRAGTHSYTPFAEVWHGVRVSAVMPFTWFVQLPGMAGFREAARLTMLGVVPAALLAGAAVDWLRRRLVLLVVPVLILAVFETGWGGNLAVTTMPAALPAVDRPIAADHSGSIVVDVPFGVRGGVPLPGEGAAFDPMAQVLATADGHPRAVGYLSRLPVPTLAAMRRHAFYDGLLTAQGQRLATSEALTGTTSLSSFLAAARADARGMHVGWVVVWRQTPNILRYLARTGFRFEYKAGGAEVFRSA